VSSGVLARSAFGSSEQIDGSICFFHSLDVDTIAKSCCGGVKIE
jgi:hypothetical protein